MVMPVYRCAVHEGCGTQEGAEEWNRYRNSEQGKENWSWIGVNEEAHPVGHNGAALVDET